MVTGSPDLDPRTLELVQRQIDGACSREESAELEAILGRDPAARRALAEMGAVARTLDGMADIPAPAGLRRDVMKEIAVRPRSLRGSEGGRLAWLWPGRVPALRYAVIVVAAVGLGVVLSQWGSLSRIRVDGRQVSGTLAPAVEPVVEPGTWAIAVEDAAGTIRRVETQDGVGIEVDMTGSGPLAVVVGFDPARARFATVEGDVAAMADGGAGLVRIVPTPGRRFTVRLERAGDAGTPVSVRLQRAEKVLQEWTIEIPGRQFSR